MHDKENPCGVDYPWLPIVLTDFTTDEPNASNILERLDADEELFDTWENFDIKVEDSFFIMSKLKSWKKEGVIMKDGKERD